MNNELKNVDKNFFLKTQKVVDEEYAKTLIGKHICFTLHDGDNVMFAVPGRVLDYLNEKLKVDTMDIFFEDDNSSEDNGSFIKEINLENIEDVFVFDKYTKDFCELAYDLVEYDKNGFTISNRYEIENVYGKLIECEILNDEAINAITIRYKDQDELKIIDYPRYLISKIKRK